MYIELKEIDKDTLKVWDVVGIARPVHTGWYCNEFRHMRVHPAIITRIIPEKAEIETDIFGVHDKNEIFYVYDYYAKREDDLAEEFCWIRDAVRDIRRFEENGLEEIHDDDIHNMAYHMKAIAEILKKYKEKM